MMSAETDALDAKPSEEWSTIDQVMYPEGYEARIAKEKLWEEQRNRNADDRKKRLNKARLKINQQGAAAPKTRGANGAGTGGAASGAAGGLGGGLGGTAPGGGLGADTVPTTGGGAAPASVAGETKGKKAPSAALATTPETSTTTYLLYGAIAVAAILLLRR
jgi:hypothetical protein